jgi:putative transposase
MNQLYKAVGISKQAVSQHAQRQGRFNEQLAGLVGEAEVLRQEHPGCGVEKMYHILKPDFLGRDKFIEVFMELGFRLKRAKNYHRTTYSIATNYPNLIQGMEVAAPSVVWQSDITYYRVGEQFYYAVFIIDVYTKKIVGYQVSDHMRATANVKALQTALNNNKAPVIHHSDKGGQYLYHKYIKLLRSRDCRISMAESAQDNAYAERINRTIKEEYLDHWKPKNLEELKCFTRKAVENYNNKRGHKSLQMRTPAGFEQEYYKNHSSAKPIITIFNNNSKLKPVNSI